MSWFIDSASVRHELFGNGGGAAVAAFAEALLLEQVPLGVRERGDKGTPFVQAAPSSEPAKAFVAIAERLVDLCEQAPDDNGGPSIDRGGGSGGKKRLPVTR